MSNLKKKKLHNGLPQLSLLQPTMTDKSCISTASFLVLENDCYQPLVAVENQVANFRRNNDPQANNNGDRAARVNSRNNLLGPDNERLQLRRKSD
ncbi:unnamed protein product, partial [Amoebophrya sp. A120]|eukprot:GSA120T00004537001.1